MLHPGSGWVASLQGRESDRPILVQSFHSRSDLSQKVDILHAPVLRRQTRIFVRALAILCAGSPGAIFSVGSWSMRCAVGRKGIGVKRFEGDSITPMGRYKIVSWRARFDRSPSSHIDCDRISKSSGWCDDPRASAYNLAVSLPLRFSAEALWRDDHLYDLIGVIDFNSRPRVRGRGSAIFLHVARDDFSPTAGCIALPRGQLYKLKAILSRKPQIFIGDKCWRRSPKIAEPTRIRVAPSSTANSKSALIPIDSSAIPNSFARCFKSAK